MKSTSFVAEGDRGVRRRARNQGVRHAQVRQGLGHATYVIQNSSGDDLLEIFPIHSTLATNARVPSG